MIRHIRLQARCDGTFDTYCGRIVTVDRVIGPRDCIDDAECKSCQRSDDRRQIAQYNRDVAEAKKRGVEL